MKRDRTPQDEALGASRGGLSTKLHLRTDGHGRPLVILATPGQRHEVTQRQRLLEGGAVKRTGPDGRPGRGRPRKRPAKLVADKGYSFPSARRLLRRRGIASVIPTKSDQRRQPSFDRAAPPSGVIDPDRRQLSGRAGRSPVGMLWPATLATRS